MNDPIIEVTLSPALFHLSDVSDKIVVVIDVFRATSTIASILENRADAVIPVDDVEKSKSFEGADIILAAERNGEKPEGFLYGNSPFDYPPDVVEDKTVVFTTTNGTKAIEMASGNCLAIVTGSFPNLSSICFWLEQQKKDVHLFCAGWKDQFSLEDTLFAGALIDCLKEQFQISGDAAFAAHAMYQSAHMDLQAFAKQSSHYKRLSKLGIEKDMVYCLTPDTCRAIPYYHDGKLTAVYPE